MKKLRKIPIKDKAHKLGGDPPCKTNVFLPTKWCWLFIVLLLSACAYEPVTIKKTFRKIEPQQNIGKKTLKRVNPGQKKLKKVYLKAPKVNDGNFSLSFSKNDLIGLTSFEVIEILGAPKLQRAEKPGSIWQYQSNLCLLDIFFFKENSDLIVDYVETRGKTIKKTNASECFSNILIKAKLKSHP